VHRLRDGQIASAAPGDGGECDDLEFADALEAFDLRRATRRLRELVDAANTELERVRPWELAKADPNDVRIDVVLADVVGRCRRLIALAAAFVPDTAGIAAERLGTGTTVGPPGRVFDRLDVPTSAG
jgi:methionyl-tRNA synthetase